MKIRTLLLASLLVPGMAFADAGYMEKKSPMMRQSPMMTGFYAKVEAGLTKPKLGTIANGVSNSTNNSLALGLGGGYIINEFFRTDLMLGYRNLHVKGDTKVRPYSAMLNGYVDAHNDTIFTPYVMGGIGINKAKAKTEFVPTLPAAAGNTAALAGKSKTNFMWNLGLGVRAKALDHMDVDLSYRYVSFGKAKFVGATTATPTTATTPFSSSVKTTANEFMAALIYRI